MGKFICHSPCPECGSRDNVSVWDDGAKCMSCAFQTFDTGILETLAEHAVKSSSKRKGNRMTYIPPTLRPITKTWRGILPATFLKYSVGLDESNNVHFQHIPHGVHVGSKVRSGTSKEYWFDGESTGIGLFGVHCASGDRRIIVTEGELDALSAYQMMGYAAVSIPLGVQSATKFIKASAQYLETFDEIVFLFDMDAVGRTAQAECVKLLDQSKVKSMSLPIGFKDANDMLVAGKEKEFKECYWSAQAYTPTGIISTEDVIERTVSFLMDKSARHGKPTGYDGLDKLIGGWRAGEVTTIVAGTGIGKSSITRALCYKQVVLGVKTLYIPLEDMLEQATSRFLEMHTASSLVKSNDVPNEALMRQGLFEVLENLTLFDQSGAISVDDLVSSIGYAVRKDCIEFVALDHISAMTSNRDTDERRALDNAIQALKLRVAKDLKCAVLVVSHISRDSSDKEDNKPTLARVKGASSIAQYSDAVLGLERERKQQLTTFRTLKASRLWGVFGEFSVKWDEGTQQFIEEVEFDTQLLDEGQAPHGEETKGTVGDGARQEVQESTRAGSLEHEPVECEGGTVRSSQDILHTEEDLQPRPTATQRDTGGVEGVAIEGEQNHTPSRKRATQKLSSRVALPQ